MFHLRESEKKKEVTPNSKKDMHNYKKTVRKRNNEKKKQNEKHNKRKWYIFVLKGV
jgi:hypothetical protein